MLSTFLKHYFPWILAITLVFCAAPANADEVCAIPQDTTSALSKDAIAKILGWVTTTDNRCGGYYLEAPFSYPEKYVSQNLFQISSDQPFLFSQRGTSIFEGRVTVTRYGQQLSANKAYLYRDPVTAKLNAVDLIGHVELREPGSLVIAKKGHFETKNHFQSLEDILYRTEVHPDFSLTPTPSNQELQSSRKITQLSAWGKAAKFWQEKSKIFNFTQASYSTCPPTAPVWNVKASEIILNKNTGRGTAKHARVLVKGVPIFYTPVLNFPIDNRRQTGFLWPRIGNSNRSGRYLQTPFYWNMAPNYDLTITPTLLAQRGVQIDNLFRYLSPLSEGKFQFSILPNDHKFKTFQETSQQTYQNSSDPVTQASLRRLLQASSTRTSFYWKDNTYYNDHWNSTIDYLHVSDDYYLKDLRTYVREISPNQLLQQGDVNYKGQIWNFTGRIQAYQTLHPIDEIQYQNQYIRLPQLILNGNYPEERTGIEFFISNELSRFDIMNNPGANMKLPIGDRLNVQPGVSWPLSWPAFFITPRVQFEMTRYNLGHIGNTNTKMPERSLPIFDVLSGINFDRDITLFNLPYRQTLEPQLYYAYIPYRNQTQIPIFDTTVNTLTYDQLFIYNRFSGLDRINDANQISAGIITRLIEGESGLEKLRIGVGEIFYFHDRRVTMCNDLSCVDNPTNNDNKRKRSPIAGTLTYNLTPHWSATANTIWNPLTRELDNQNLNIQYQTAANRILNFGYTYVRDGDGLPHDPLNSPQRNLKQTDISTVWPLTRDWGFIGRWSQNWNHNHFQNLLSGLQYDSCCWAIRLVAGRTYLGITPANTFQYDTQFYIQFALKGLGNIGSGIGTTGTNDPSGFLVTSVPGYQENFGRDF